MSNAIFPSNLPGITWDNSKSPIFSTIVRTATSGKELRAAFYSYPLWDFHLSYDVLRDSIVGGINELKTIVGFFLARQGKFDSFLFTDPSDNAVVDQQIGIGNASNTLFQLIRDYGGFVEPVMNVNTIAGVKLNGVVTTLYSIDSKGRITMNTAPGAGVVVTWSGSYYYRCRFKEDTVDLKQFLYQFWELKKLDLHACLGDKI